MRRIHVLIAMSIMALPVLCRANPDGPTGSVVVLPTYSFTDADYEGADPLSSNWVAGLSILVPSGRYATLGFKVEGGDVTSKVSLPNIGNRVRFEFSAKFYIPLTKSARGKLENWDEGRGGVQRQEAEGD